MNNDITSTVSGGVTTRLKMSYQSTTQEVTKDIAMIYIQFLHYCRFVFELPSFHICTKTSNLLFYRSGLRTLEKAGAILSNLAYPVPTNALHALLTRGQLY